MSSSLVLTCVRTSGQIVNKDLHAAYAELKKILKQDIEDAAKVPQGMGFIVPAVAIAAVAIGAFYFLRK